MAGIVELRYATSLFEVAIEQDCLDEVLEEIYALKTVFEQNPEFVKFLNSPTIRKEEKIKVIDAVFKDRLGSFTKNFLSVLAEKGRFSAFDGIVKQFRLLYNKHNAIVEIDVISAIPLSDKLSEKLTKRLEDSMNKTVRLRKQVEPSIVGGIVLKIDNELVDASLKKRFEAIKHKISQGVLA